MPFRANCPACGAPVAFRSSASFHAVCEFCRSTLVRQDGKLENLGRMADLVEDASPLRLGSEGRYQGTHFAIIGRIQLRYAAGVWNEWHLLFDDQRTGWLSDAAGEYVVSFLTPPRAELPSLESLAPEDALTLAGREFVVTDIEQATCVAGEGELPFSFGAGYPAPLVDLRTRDGAAAGFATIDYSETPPLFFVGQSLPFAAFAFTGLRDGEAAARPAAVAALQCPACGGPIAIHDKAVLSVACPSCLTVLDAQDPKLRVLQKAAAALRVEPAIALGSVGRFGGREWTVIGFQQRAIVPGDGPPWQEYLLHHPQEGFRWLVEAQGHWNWVSPLAKLPVHRPGAPTATLGGESFRRFSAGKAETRFVIGEFTWTVSVGETWDTADFIAPPRMLSREANGNEVTWSVGDYLPPAEVAAAFGIKDPLPAPTGIGMNQPNPRIDGHRTTCSNFWRFAGLALLAQLLWVFVLGGHSLLDQRLVFSPRAEEPLTTRAFRLDGGARALAVRHDTDLDNNWLGLNLTLVDKDSGRAWHARTEVSYWQGSDGGERWSEGDRARELVFRDIPPGNYHFVIDGEVSDERPVAVADRITVVRNPAPWSNLFLLLGFLAVFPVLSRLGVANFEASRWREADFLPGGAVRPAVADSDGDSGADD